MGYYRRFDPLPVGMAVHEAGSLFMLSFHRALLQSR